MHLTPTVLEASKQALSGLGVGNGIYFQNLHRRGLGDNSVGEVLARIPQFRSLAPT